jgi:uncharacterized OB-fold protein
MGVVLVSAAIPGSPPAITPENEVFWAEAANGRLVVDRCRRCDRCWFPARRWCADCGRADTIDPYHRLLGPGRLYSWTVNHVAWSEGVEVPYTIGLVDFDEAAGVRVLGRIRAGAVNELAIDLPLEIGFEPGPGGVAIPSFTVVPTVTKEHVGGD